MQKKIKRETGSAAVLVLSSLFLILIILVNLYVASANKNRGENEAFQKIQEAYNMSDEEMQKTYEKLTTK